MAITRVFKDAVPTTQYRKYQLINNSDGTVSLVDVTEYEQEGTYLNAKTLNDYTNELNEALENAPRAVISQLTIATTDWSNNSYTYAVSGYDKNTKILKPTPADKESQTAWGESGIFVNEGSTNGTIVFTCESTPTVAINVTLEMSDKA